MIDSDSRSKYNSEISGKLVQMLGICDSEHDSFDASRSCFKVEANSRAGKNRNLRIDKSDQSQSKILKPFFEKNKIVAFAMRNNDERNSDESERQFGRGSIGDAASRDEETY